MRISSFLLALLFLAACDSTPTCDDDYDCAESEVCKVSQQQCVAAPKCKEDADCGDDRICIEFRCVDP